MNKKTVEDIDVAGKRVLVRVDFNVPLSGSDSEEGIVVADDTRIRAALPTLNYLLQQQASLILCSHLGRPQSAADRQFVMEPVGKRLSELLARPVRTLDAVVGANVSAVVAHMSPGDVVLLENTRFEAGEKKNDPELAATLAQLADVYVNDAFGSAHRAHASTAGVAEAMRAKGGESAAGFLLQKEMLALGAAAQNPAHPYVAIMGGAKISDKIQLIEKLLEKADRILIGGGMANTFLHAKGFETGISLVEASAVPEAQRLLAAAGDRLVLPVDVLVADRFAADALADIRPVAAIPSTGTALDIGPDTVALFTAQLSDARLVVWNGPMGVFEFERFAQGTFALAAVLADLVAGGAEVVVGGGDSAAAVRQAGLTAQMSHVSTGGGASLELLEGRELPGIAALDDKPAWKIG